MQEAFNAGPEWAKRRLGVCHQRVAITSSRRELPRQRARLVLQLAALLEARAVALQLGHARLLLLQLPLEGARRLQARKDNC